VTVAKAVWEVAGEVRFFYAIRGKLLVYDGSLRRRALEEDHLFL
jgi:hypothetical protein